MNKELTQVTGTVTHRSASIQCRQHHPVLSLLLVWLAVLAGSSCRRSPNQASKRFFASGLDYFGQEKYDAASIQFRNAIQKEPRAWAPHYWLALTELKQRRWQDADREFNVVVELQPSLFAARLKLADLLLSGGNNSEAREQVNEVEKLSPNNVRAQTLLAKINLAEKDYPAAIEAWEKAKQLAPQDREIWTGCGLARVAAQQPALAEKDFRRALELAPHSAEAHRNLANVLQLLKRGDEAGQLLETGVQSNSRSLEMHLVLAEFYFQQKRVDDVEKLFAQMKSHATDFPGLDLEQADFWMSRNEVARAAKGYEAALAKSSDVLVQKKLASACITLGRLDDAERLDQQILAKNPKDVDGKTFRGALRHLRGDSAGAVEELRAVLKEEPKSQFANYYLGLALMAVGKLDEAEAAFVDCIRYNDKSLEAYQHLAQLRLQRHDWDTGLEYAKKVIALAPGSLNGYLLVAEDYFYRGDIGKARQILDGLQKAAPDSPGVAELRGAVDISQGKTEAGVKEYERAWAHSSQPLAPVFGLTNVAVHLGHPDAAIQPVRQLIARQPQPVYFAILARLYLAKGDLEAAKDAGEQALRLDSSQWLAHFYLGETCNRLGRADEALSHYDKVIRGQPKQIPPYIMAGDICLRIGKFEKAANYYQAALKQEPNSGLALHGVARVWAEQGLHLDEAMAQVQGLQQRFPDDPHLSDTLAWIYYHKGRYADAVPLLRRALEQDSKSALFHFHLGMTYAKLGETNPGRRELESALKLGLESARWETAARQVLNGLSPVNG